MEIKFRYRARCPQSEKQLRRVHEEALHNDYWMKSVWPAASIKDSAVDARPFPGRPASAPACRLSQGRIEDWPAAWASDSILVAYDAFAGLTFKLIQTEPGHTWSVAFDDDVAYLRAQDAIKRKQLAKGGARLAEILNAIWPKVPILIGSDRRLLSFISGSSTAPKRSHACRSSPAGYRRYRDCCRPASACACCP